MKKTKHFVQRMSQRGITQSTVDLALELGHFEGDHYVLDRRVIDRELDLLDSRRRALIKARDKGGVVVVGEGATLVTTYRYDGKNRH